MDARILSLNCQKGMQPAFEAFLAQILDSRSYDFLLLQEFSPKVEQILATSTSYVFRKLGSVAVVSRGSYPILDLQHISFNTYLGALAIVVDTHGQRCVIGSAHLHAGFSGKTRLLESQKIKTLIKTMSSGSVLTIFGGDFNLGPFEAARINGLMQPEFVDVTADIGPTLDSMYTEAAPYAVNRIARALGRIGINLRFHTDHVFAGDREAAKSHISSRTLPDRVSDHRPVEILFQGL